MMRKRLYALLFAPLVLVAVACEQIKTADPLSPTVAGPIPGVNITAPKPVEPSGAKVAVGDQPLALVVENASSNGPRPLSYAFELATDAGFANKLLSRDGITPGSGGRTTLRLPDPLGPERTYYWRARAQDGANAGPYSTAANFDVFTPTAINAPVPVMPIGNVRTENVRPRFMVTNASREGLVGTISYVFELSDTDTFANKLAVWTVGEQQHQTALDTPQDLQYGKQYFWHARAFDGTTTGPWTTTQAFQTPAVTLEAPQLVFPASGVTIEGVHPRFQWTNAARSVPVGPVTYTLELSESDAFAPKLAIWAVGEQTNQTVLDPPQDLSYAKRYFWRVRASSQLAVGPWSATFSFQTPTPTLGQPQLVAPANDETIDDLAPTFVWDNAPRTGPVGSVTYTLELADSDSFTNKIAVWAVGEQTNQTSLLAPQGLSYGEEYFWRVRASSSLAVGPWSSVQAFQTPELPLIPPTPEPGPAPNPGAPCGPPYPGTPLGIVECQRSHYGQSMSPSDLVSMLRGVARDLNAAGISGGPFGILRKTGGNQCVGYSCDIICAGQDTAQQQWDVLSDAGGASNPQWTGPHGYPGIRVDVCEIQ